MSVCGDPRQVQELQVERTKRSKEKEKVAVVAKPNLQKGTAQSSATPPPLSAVTFLTRIHISLIPSTATSPSTTITASYHDKGIIVLLAARSELRAQRYLSQPTTIGRADQLTI